MKIVGQFNDKPIALESLFITQTYLGFLSIYEEGYPGINKNILEKTLPELVEEHFGKGNKLVIIKDPGMDLTKRLPDETACAALIGASPTNKGDYSHLIIAWLQEPCSDIYEAIKEVVKRVDWLNEAEDGKW